MNDSLLTALMIIVTIIMFAVVYLLPIAGIISGSILLKRKPKKKTLGLTILLVSAFLCLVVYVWKILDIINFQ